ncbi:ATP-dependent DNA ligase [Planctomonas sp. JC2975]|uniref:ATP-dependent DNA ligase n=1 Tax=Planctomonas sp. JC2975 TaxID=2729626 RepID=UPI0014766907|nr:ATP-dependent DNA ligase [Planctomonas sp. JC2975]NNC10376.1 ATP-dependent DNA ligase [Planctomonas sp. JC2975]
MTAGGASDGAGPTVVEVDGHRIKLSNLDKVLYPETGTTKGDVLSYYARIADHLIEHAHGRPATRKRWVNGVGTAEHPGQPFFQKNLDEGTPAWVPRVSIQHSDHVNVYPLVNEPAVLTWLGQIAALEIHVPQWQAGPRGARRNPDRLVLDLDPGDGVGLLECAEVAGWARDILSGMGLDPVPVTSGSKGIHLYARLDGRQTSDQASQVAHELARALEADHRGEVISTMKRVDRAGKVFIDWSQNNSNKTTIAPYSLRGRAHPTVATPRTWRELASPKLRQLDYEEVLDRVAKKGDPLADARPHAIDAGAQKPERGDAGRARDRLTVYRSKRDADKTPEPVPAGTPATTSGRSFVIQKHAARRLHYDFRLERDGVLVSWALPKGVPTDTKTNHLAVHVEDHPLDYGGFHGDIPHGEYGAGHVDIWDSGVYDLEKWRGGEEVIVTLHPSPDGGLGGKPVKVALIHTGKSGAGGSGDDKNWLIHRMVADRVRKDYSPMLATLGTQAELEHDPERWAFEDKWDGIRAIAYVTDGAVRLVTRNGNDVTAQYPELTGIADGVRSPVVIDGEIVALDDGRPDFGLLQQRMNLQDEAEISRVANRVPVRYYVFDILELDGHDITGEEYEVRRAALEHVVADRHRGVLQVPDTVDGPIDAAMKQSRSAGYEGIVAKDRRSTYAAGRRSTSWIKVKHHSTQEVVVGGWKPGEGRRENGVGSLLLGIPDGDALAYVGKVGTGFGDAELDEIAERLVGVASDTDPFDDIPAADARGVRWVEPVFVGEVEFAEWTRGGRLRQPSWRGWRTDKDPKDVVRESS